MYLIVNYYRLAGNIWKLALGDLLIAIDFVEIIGPVGLMGYKWVVSLSRVGRSTRYPAINETPAYSYWRGALGGSEYISTNSHALGMILTPVSLKL